MAVWAATIHGIGWVIADPDTNGPSPRVLVNRTGVSWFLCMIARHPSISSQPRMKLLLKYGQLRGGAILPQFPIHHFSRLVLAATGMVHSSSEANPAKAERPIGVEGVGVSAAGGNGVDIR